jgi:hypothetical protein
LLLANKSAIQSVIPSSTPNVKQVAQPTRIENRVFREVWKNNQLSVKQRERSIDRRFAGNYLVANICNNHLPYEEQMKGYAMAEIPTLCLIHENFC